jgi:hypothetical protein
MKKPHNQSKARIENPRYRVISTLGEIAPQSSCASSEKGFVPGDY